MIRNLKKKIIHNSNSSNSDSVTDANQNTKWEALQKLYDEELSKSNKLSSDRDVLESSLFNKEKLLVDKSKQLDVMQKMLSSYQKNVSTEHDLFEKEYNRWLAEKSKFEDTIDSLQSQLIDNSKASNNEINSEAELQEQEDCEKDQPEIKNSFLGFMENLHNSLNYSTSSAIPNETNSDNSIAANSDDENKSEISFSIEKDVDNHSVSSSLIDESLEIQNDQDIQINNFDSEEQNNSILIHDLKSDIKEASQKLAELNNVYTKMTSSHNAILSDADNSHALNTSEISDNNNFDISVDDVDYDYNDIDYDENANAIINIDYQKLKTLETELGEHSEFDNDDQCISALTHKLSKYSGSRSLKTADDASILNKFGDLNSELNHSKELNFSLLLFVNQLVKDVEHLQKESYKNPQLLLDDKTSNSLAVVKKFDDGIVDQEINEHLHTVKNFLESHNYDNINRFPHPLRKKSSRLALTASEDIDNDEEVGNHKLKKSTSNKQLTDSHHSSFLPTRKLSKFFKKNTAENSHIPVSKSSNNASRVDTSNMLSKFSSTKANSKITQNSEHNSAATKNYDSSNNKFSSQNHSSPSKSILSTSSKNASSDDTTDIIDSTQLPVKKKLNDRRHSSHQPSIKRTLSNKAHEKPVRQSIGNKISRVFSNNVHSNFSLEKYHEKPTNPFIVNNENKLHGIQTEEIQNKNGDMNGKELSLSRVDADITKNKEDVISEGIIHKAQSLETVDTSNSIPSMLAKNEIISNVQQNHTIIESSNSLPINNINELAHQDTEDHAQVSSSRKNKKAVIKSIDIGDDEKRGFSNDSSLKFHDGISDIIEEEDVESFTVNAEKNSVILSGNEQYEDISASAARGSVIIADPIDYVEEDPSNFHSVNESISVTKIDTGLVECDSSSDILYNGKEKVSKVHSSSSEIHSKNSTLFSSNDDNEDAHNSLHDDAAASQELGDTNQNKNEDLQLDVELLNHSEPVMPDFKSNKQSMNEESMDAASVIESICDMILKDKAEKSKEPSKNGTELASDHQKISYDLMGNILESTNPHHIIANKSLIMSIHSFLENEKYDSVCLKKNPILKMLVSKYTNHYKYPVNSTIENIEDLNVVD